MEQVQIKKHFKDLEEVQVKLKMFRNIRIRESKKTNLLHHLQINVWELIKKNWNSGGGWDGGKCL